jgi:hypothetical protein
MRHQPDPTQLRPSAIPERPLRCKPKAVTLLYSGEIIDDKQKQQRGLAQLK